MTKKKENWIDGRPSKLTDNFLKVVKEVLNDNMNAIIYTDEELLFEINERLPKKENISIATWKNYKRYTQNKEEVNNLRKVDIDKISQFLAIYKKAINIQKKNLFQQLSWDEKAWQRWAWIIERKFSEWNLKHIGEIKQETEMKVELKEEAKAFLEELD